MEQHATYGLIGFPLGHSCSPKYFTEKFKQEGRNAEYLPFEIEDISELKNILVRYPDLKGFNITIPHKQNIIPLLNRMSEEAEQVGAVNCVKVERINGEIHLTGYNTDVYGFKNSLLEFIPRNIKKALVLGNGGAAKAVRYALHSLGMDVLTVSRTPKTAVEIGYSEVPALLGGYKLIVNTTPLGTWPKTENCPDLPYEQLSPEHYLFDLVYNPETTKFMKRGAAAGAHTRNGFGMWKGQAEKSWEIWGSKI